MAAAAVPLPARTVAGPSGFLVAANEEGTPFSGAVDPVFFVCTDPAGGTPSLRYSGPLSSASCGGQGQVRTRPTGRITLLAIRNLCGSFGSVVSARNERLVSTLAWQRGDLMNCNSFGI